MTDPRPLVLLLHSASGSYPAALRRARLVQRGAEVLHPELCFDRFLGRTPDDDPTTGAAPTNERLVDHAARRLANLGGALDSGPVGAVWVVSDLSPDVEQQLAVARGAGVGVRVLVTSEVEWLLTMGETAERLADEAGPVAEADAEAFPFVSVEAVVHAYFGGADSILGLQALPLARLCRSGGNAHGRQSQLEVCGLRISLAGGIMHRAMASPRWRASMLTVLRVAYAEGGTMAQAAVEAGYGYDDVARRRASRLRSRAMDLVRASLDETQARCRSAK